EAKVEKVLGFVAVQGITDLVFSPDGKRIATVTGNGLVHLWDAETGRQVAKIETGVAGSRPAFSPDGVRFATAGPNKSIMLRNATPGDEVRTLTGFDDTPALLAFSPNGHWIVVGESEAGRVTAWDVVRDDSEPLRFDKEATHPGGVTAIVFDP